MESRMIDQQYFLRLDAENMCNDPEQPCHLVVGHFLSVQSSECLQCIVNPAVSSCVCVMLHILKGAVLVIT